MGLLQSLVDDNIMGRKHIIAMSSAGKLLIVFLSSLLSFSKNNLLTFWPSVISRFPKYWQRLADRELENVNLTLTLGKCL